LTFSLIIFEVSIVRLFSIYLSYHFAFMVVSIAMLGIGSAGTILSFRTEKPAGDLTERLSAYPLLTGIAIIASYIISNRVPFDPVRLSWDKMQIPYFSMYCFVFSIPFFFSGMMIATAFHTLSKKAQSIYASDLIGAGIGSLCVILLLNNASPEYAVISASITSLISSTIIGDIRFRGLAFIIILICFFLFIFHPEFMDIRISPYKNLSVALKYPDSEHIRTYNHSIARIDILKSPMIRFAPGLSLKYTEPLPEQIGIAIDGGELYAVTRADNERALQFLDHLPSTIAYKLRKSENVLIIDPKGGLHVLMARRYKVKDIHKIESNPLLIDVIRNELGGFSKGIFEDHIWQGYGRNFIQRTGGYYYDIIDLSMTGTTVSSFFGIMEDYRYTVEAFKAYLTGLKDDGILSISMYLIPPPRKEFRTLATAITALKETGTEETWRNIITIRSWDTMTMLIKKLPFSDREVRDIKRFVKERGFDFIFYPGIREEDTGIYIRTTDKEYFRGFKSIIDPEERKQFIDDYLFDIRPVHDENPFFHYYLKIKNIKGIYNLMGKKWLYFIEEGYLTPFVLIITLLLSTFMILLPVSFKTGFERFKPFELLPPLLYFSMLGLGFMFVEVTLIQKYILILENPVYSFSLVLTTILISSGTGSMLSSRFKSLQGPIILLLLSYMILIYSFIQPVLFGMIIPLSPFTAKIPIILLSIIPYGLLMGVPFPMGIRLLGQKKPALIPWAWAINAFLSVIAPVITIMIATTTGFRSILYLASAAYIIAYASLKRL
jgi:hypothetical protein